MVRRIGKYHQNIVFIGFFAVYNLVKERKHRSNSCRVVGVTVIGVVVAGVLGPVLGPTVFKFVGVKNPVAFGLGMGSASHAIGTSKALEIGEIQGAMSSLAIVVTGVLTVIMVPIIINFAG
jgi:putative effector of murein hydrolase